MEGKKSPPTANSYPIYILVIHKFLTVRYVSQDDSIPNFVNNGKNRPKVLTPESLKTFTKFL